MGWGKRTLEEIKWGRAFYTPREVKPTTIDIGWAAGIYEGEGSCQYAHTLKVNVSQREPEILFRLQKLFGGNVSNPYKDVRYGSSYRQWRLSGARAHGFLMTIYKFLTELRKHQILPHMKREISSYELSDSRDVVIKP